ncbi:uncharacterized protein LOC117344838 [Pecten maximus]|uniref:uncharacterized protein LOC117344838 n=1 Tax=Pecten maximus TaxID=6579 RepID=UPI00145916B6|nr:uncharacterized protein LOC117344838 [Pecten maximus]XP_033763569.1 uncharacterized protein LOC117344838 [Pecten maximus]
MASGGRPNMNIITTGAGDYDEDYVRKKIERANLKVAAAMEKIKKAQKQVTYVEDSSSDSSDDEMGDLLSPQDFNKNPDGAAIHIKKQIGNGAIANIRIGSAKNIQVGDRNTMVINKGTRTPRQEKREEDMMSIEDVTPPPELTTAQQAVLDSDKIVDDVKLQALTTVIGKQYRRIFRKLEIYDEDIDQLYQDYKGDGIRTVIYQGLLMWKKKTARNATVGTLVKAIYGVTKNTKVMDSMIN